MLLVMTFVGVEFSNNNDEDDTVMGIVHRSWLKDKDEVWWPFYKTGIRINKALMKAEVPNKETWELCTINRILFEYGMCFL